MGHSVQAMIGAPGDTTKTVVAGMGELKVVNCDSGVSILLKMTLGSCVGLFLSDSSNGVYGFAHIMLPERLTADGVLGKYADTALPELIRRMAKEPSGMKAFVVGGASMFRSEKPTFVSDVGNRNVEAVLRITEDLSIPVVYKDTGGNRGRTVIFNCLDETISVRTLSSIQTSQGQVDAEYS